MSQMNPHAHRTSRRPDDVANGPGPSDSSDRHQLEWELEMLVQGARQRRRDRWLSAGAVLSLVSLAATFGIYYTRIKNAERVQANQVAALSAEQARVAELSSEVERQGSQLAERDKRLAELDKQVAELAAAKAQGRTCKNGGDAAAAKGTRGRADVASLSAARAGRNKTIAKQSAARVSTGGARGK